MHMVDNICFVSETFQSLLRQQPVHRVKGYVRAADLVENEIEKQNLPTRFHFEARKGTFIKA